MNSMDIQKLPVSKLNPAKYNPRLDLKPGDTEYEKLLRSVEEFGYVEPIIWNKRTGLIVGGHQRLKVLVQLGYTEIECVVVDMDETREKALNVALNKISGEWDLEKLAKVFTELDDSGMGFELTGFEQKEMDKLFQELNRKSGGVTQDEFSTAEELAAIETAVTKLGDIWEIGRHRLMCGDSTDISSVLKLMAGKKAKMLFTDPPWNVDFGGSEHPSWKKRSILNDKMSADDFYKFLVALLTSAQSACEPGAPAYIVMSSQEFGALQYAAKEVGFHWSSTITWVKDTHVMSRKDYHTQTEFIWYGWREGAGRLVHLEDRNQSDAWQIPRPKKSIEHPTMKPIELVAKALNNSSRKDDLVLDLFGGSGSTLIAAEQTDRTAHLMELDPKYCDVIAIRFAKMQNTDSGIYLVRDGKRMSFNEAMEAVPETEAETSTETEESQS